MMVAQSIVLGVFLLHIGDARDSMDKLASRLINELFDESTNVLPHLHTEADNTTLGKRGHLAMHRATAHRPPQACTLTQHPNLNIGYPVLPWGDYWRQFNEERIAAASSVSSTEAGTATEEKARPRPGEKKGFVEEMRFVAMKLHTKDQAPKEGGRAADPNKPKFAPTREGYLSFLVESKVVFEALERLMAAASHPSYAKFQNTGLERSAALEQDIAALSKEYGLEVPVPTEDGPGRTYEKLVTKLAEDDPPAFMCHFYNQYFAHTAGGRMIGKMVSDRLLDGKNLSFYQYEGDIKELLNDVRTKIDATATEWSRDQKDHCLQETEKSFKYSGAILKCISQA